MWFYILNAKALQTTLVTLTRYICRKLDDIEAAHKYRPLLEISDYELLGLINDTPKATLAFEEFYLRYKGFVFKVCRNCCNGFDSQNLLADDIFQNTFIRVLDKAYTFKPKEDSDITNISVSIKAWLSRIAKNELINFLRKNPDEKFLSNTNRLKSNDIVDLQAGEDCELETNKPETPSIQKQVLERGLSKLTDTERAVLMTYMTYYDPRTPNRHLPDDILSNLCTMFKQQPGGIRQIKLRALKKLKETRDESIL